MSHGRKARLAAIVAAGAALCTAGGPALAAASALHDVVVRHAMIYDGGGGAPYAGELAIDGDRIAYVGPQPAGKGRLEVDARGEAVSPGFIDMMGHSEESLLVDGRGVSALKQGVTLDVFTEGSMGPLTPGMAKLMKARQGDVRFDVTWSTLGQYLEHLEKHGISPNVASFVGEGEVRVNVLGEGDVQPTPAQLEQMRALVHQAMEEGALGLTTALIYAPNNYAKTPELMALARESARCGGMYTAHMRSEGDHIEEAVEETIDIARDSGAPAEIHHFKFIGRDNWGKRDKVVAMITAARAGGIRITADMYTYTAGGTALAASLPPWAHAGGPEALVKRLEDPAERAKIIAAMKEPHPRDWENLYQQSGADGMLVLAARTPGVKRLIGKTIAQIARERGVSPEDAIVDLVIEDDAGVGAAYTIISEANIAKQIVLPWVSSGSDAESSAPEGVFLLSSTHPRAYGNFARLFAKYVREERLLTVQEAVRKLTSLPADVLSLQGRGRLKAGNFADVVIFDPAKIQDHSTYAKPMQYATGVTDVFVNGKLALKDGEPTGSRSGRVLRGRAWTGASGGGCRRSSRDWTWIDQPPRAP
ncbi:MAG TPA: amidohydrolase family protein [Steroidobacteraceae bacterium]|nr:amidohydrolase family protein [Steroidobacteraceae bacterium]